MTMQFVRIWIDVAMIVSPVVMVALVAVNGVSLWTLVSVVSAASYWALRYPRVFS